MYTLHLDLHLKFAPPMSGHGQGIVLTRAVQLPFVPASSLRICGASLDECLGPMGFGLEELTWDIDREVFFARTQIISHDEPLAFIPDTIRSWLDLGWELGSYADTYEEADESDDSTELEDDGEYERLEVLHTLPKTRRDRQFNQFFKALVRLMAESFDNCDVAFAMDKLGRLVPEEKPGPDESAIHQKWRALQAEYHGMTQDEQFAWMDSLTKYPTIERVLKTQNAGRQS